jgi:hypothetical protein
VSHAASQCAVTPPSIATDDAHQDVKVTEFWQKLDAMVAAIVNTKKKYDTTHAQVLAATTLLEEEERATFALTEEARATMALIEPPSSMSPRTPTGHTAPTDDDYKAAIIANIHV